MILNKNFKFISKAQTLKKLKKTGKNQFIIPKFIFFSKKDYTDKKKILFKKIKSYFKNDIILRSSANDEDKSNSSSAGKYDSFKIKNVSEKNLELFINKILNKFKSHKDEILVQEYITNPDFSGVVFTADIDTDAPYYIINYDSSGKSDLITSGKKNTTEKTVFIYKNHTNLPNKFFKLIKTIKFLEKITHNERLDIEFIIKGGEIYILQVRPLKKTKKLDKKKFYNALINIKKKISKFTNDKNNLYGNQTAFSNMSDWNPAEMIGAKAKKLSISLYQELITDSIWAKQRSDYFYLNVHPNKLMIDLAGCPYINLKTDFNSFLPKNLNAITANKLINYFIETIKKNPNLHDKIEFNLIPTCYSLIRNQKIKEKISVKEYKKYVEELRSLSNKIFNLKDGPFIKDIKLINKLENTILKKETKTSDYVNNIYFLINECKDFGTKPFAGVARTAFIATSLLNDLKNLNLINNDELIYFYSSIKSVTKNLNKDLKLLNQKISHKKTFLIKYGHLRPSTYSISSKNYKEGFKEYFKPSKFVKENIDNERKKYFFKNTLKINKILKKNKLNFNFQSLIKISEEAIYMREFSKYLFTKYIDLIFYNLISLSKTMGINRDDLNHISIRTILDSYNNLSIERLENILKDEIKKSKKMFSITKAIKLPEVIKDEDDVFLFEQITKSGNFITEKSITKTKYFLKNLNEKNIFKNCNGKIIFIENADPGYDFLFNFNILGLVTKYGGANSHMAIRCSELNIPAVIGVGEKKFDELQKYQIIEINCLTKNIKGL